jgi:hypothetical protein
MNKQPTRPAWYARLRYHHHQARQASAMIKGVFYAEFDNVAGPQIVFQAPYK